MGKQVQERPTPCSAVTGRTPYRNTPNSSIRIPFSRIYYQMKITPVSSQGLSSASSRRSRIIPVKKGIISISTAHSYRSTMRKYTIFYRYAGVYIGFPKTESFESSLVQTRRNIRVGTSVVRDYSLSRLPGADEARRKESIHQADLNERQE